MTEGPSWVTILPRTKLGPHRRHFFQLQNIDHTKYTHVMLTIHPDGGIKRIRVIGTQSTGTSPENRVLISREGEILATSNAEGEPRCGSDGVRCVDSIIQKTGVRCLVVGK